MRKFFGNLFIISGFVYTTWFLFGGGIDYYPTKDRLQENFAMEFVNIVSNLAVISFFLISGFLILLQSKVRGELQILSIRKDK
jgi:hypothetical protein